jgi:hypothetical protein
MTPAPAVAPVDAPPPWWSHERVVTVLAFVVVSIPLVVAAVALTRVRWYPVLDLAMTELRVRDVGTRNTPLIGLPGRIGQFPDQGSHPGPISFYLLTAPYRLLGSSAWALQAASILVNVLAVAAALWIGARRAGTRGVIVVAAVLAVAMRGYGIVVLSQPWNPYLPLLFWLVVLLATWSVLCGDHRMLVPLVVAGSVCAQTHVPYLVLCVGMGALALGSLLLQLRHVEPGERRPWLTSVGVALGAGLVMWSPPVVDQLRRTPGNIRMLYDHFTAPSEDTIGLVNGMELLFRHLDLVGAFGRMLTEPGAFLTAGFRPDGRIWPGALALALWGVSVVLAWRLRHHALIRLHVVVGVATVLGVASMARIFGKVWYYLTLWAWGTSTLMLAAVVWTFVAWWRQRSPASAIRASEYAVRAAAVVAIVATLGTAVEAISAEPPEPHLSETLGDVLAPTLGALRDGTGAATGTDGRYVVTWNDAYFFGSQGYGLVSELERAGFRAGVYEPWRVPVTAHRVLRRDEVTAGVHLATGVYIADWRGREGAVEVAFVEPRSPDELAEYAALRELVLDDLAADGLDELVGLVDSNLFLVSNDTRVSRDAAAAMARMLVLGQETAVFVLEPEVTP